MFLVVTFNNRSSAKLCSKKEAEEGRIEKCLGSLLSLMELEPPREHLSFCLICSLSSSLQPVGWGLFAWHFTGFFICRLRERRKEKSFMTKHWTFCLHPLQGNAKGKGRPEDVRLLMRLLSVNTSQMQAFDSVRYNLLWLSPCSKTF